MTLELAATKEVAELARPLLGSPVKQLSELLADRVRLWRWKSAIGIMKRAREIREEEGLQGNEVSLKFFLPFIEEASKEDEKDELLSDLWARLLARADKTTTGFDLVCIDILKAMGPMDASLLRFISRGSSWRWPSDRLRQILQHEPSDSKTSWDNLENIIVQRAEIPAVTILYKETSFAKDHAYTIKALSKMGLIGEAELRFHPKIHKLLVHDRGSISSIGQVLTLTDLGTLFMARCGEAPGRTNDDVQSDRRGTEFDLPRG
jgi:hypothetical protein